MSATRLAHTSHDFDKQPIRRYRAITSGFEAMGIAYRRGDISCRIALAFRSTCSATSVVTMEKYRE